MTPCQRKLLSQLRIDDNKIYENLPTEGTRRATLINYRGGPLHQKQSRSRGFLSRNDQPSLQTVISTGASLEQLQQERVSSLQNDHSLIPKRKGRPKIYLARTLKHNEDEFTIHIKYNPRNRKAAQIFGPSALEKLKSNQSQSYRSPSDYERPRHTGSVSGVIKRRSKTEKLHLSKQRSSSTTTLNFSDRIKSKPELPYRGLLSFPECTINDTDPTSSDRKLFAKLAIDAENERVKCELDLHFNDNLDTLDSRAVTPVPNLPLPLIKSQIEKIQFRDFIINTWYSSPYPEEFSKSRILYICEHCLKYMRSPLSFKRHQMKNCNNSNCHPPGMEIYKDAENNISVWEVDGRKNIEYCQNLCLLAKLYLNSKTLYYDVEPFIFYVLTEIDEQDRSIYHFVGYFSKEKLNSSDYNVSCILTLPIYQRKGYGNFLIQFSYLLSRTEFKPGTPEKPLSDLGLLSYRNYWKVTMAFTLDSLYERFIKDRQGIQVTLNNLSKLTGMKPSDVVVGLEQLECLIKDASSGKFFIVLNFQKIKEVIKNWQTKKYLNIKPDMLLWKPMIFGPSEGINSAPATLLNLASETFINEVNNIPKISDFLQDDIFNPQTFEEEGLHDIENLSKSVAEPMENLPSNYVVCHPEFKNGIPMRRSNALDGFGGVKESEDVVNDGVSDSIEDPASEGHDSDSSYDEEEFEEHEEQQLSDQDDVQLVADEQIYDDRDQGEESCEEVDDQQKNDIPDEYEKNESEDLSDDVEHGETEDEYEQSYFERPRHRSSLRSSSILKNDKPRKETRQKRLRGSPPMKLSSLHKSKDISNRNVPSGRRRLRSALTIELNISEGNRLNGFSTKRSLRSSDRSRSQKLALTDLTEKSDPDREESKAFLRRSSRRR